MGKQDKKKKKSAKGAKKESGGTTVDEEEDQDHRFDAKLSQPQFRKPKQKDDGLSSSSTTKVVLDERFASALSDPRFQLDVQDKYGRRRRKGEKEKGKKELSEFYTVIEKQDIEGGETNNDVQEPKKASSHRHPRKQKALDSQHKADDPKEDEETKKEEESNPSSRIAYLTALSRGMLDVSSSSDDDDDDDDDDSQSAASKEVPSEDEESDDDEEAVTGEKNETAGVLDPSFKEKDDPIEITTESTSFLAVQNMDWSHVRAVDILALLMSFSPPGSVKRVRVYLSDLGKEKLAEEERLGPSDIWKKEMGKAGVQVPTTRGGDSGDEDGHDSDDSNPESHEEESDHSDAHDSDVEEEPIDSDDEEDLLPDADHVDSGFDPEKLRAYEAQKLKYYFAIAEFSSPERADMAYKEVDGLEFEHSSAAVDLRAIPQSELDHIIQDRIVRDEASSLPSNYVPPDFVVGALQQTKLQCTWEIGDRDRDRTLTKYTSGEAWKSLAESDDLKAYLASDASSDEEVGHENKKKTNMRKLLGLDTTSDQEDSNNDSNHKKISSDAEESSDFFESDDDESEVGGETSMSKEVTFIPGEKKQSLETKIRSKLEKSDDTQEESTPWQKFLEKRKEKRKERRQAAKLKRQVAKGTSSQPHHGTDEEEEEDDDEGDDDRGGASGSPSKMQSLEELELLVAGDDQDEDAKDYDMRELQRLEKNKDKKLRGSRKRKENARAATVSGTDFQLNLQDDRFNAVLEGDDARFGIDRTDPNFKETPAMKEILAEQARRRKSKKQKVKSNKSVVPNVNADGLVGSHTSSGEAALSALVTRIKSKVKS